MSDYRYQGGPKNDTVYWLIALGLIFTGFTAPIGVLMIVMKLLGGGEAEKKRRRQQGRHPYYEQQAGQDRVGARTTASAAPEEPIRQTSYAQTPPAWETPVRKKAPNAPKAPKTKTPKGSPQSIVTKLERSGKLWALGGGVLAAACLIGFVSSLGGPLYWLFNGEPAFFIEGLMELMPLPCFAAGGLGFLWAGLRRRKRAKRCRSYLNIIGRQNIVSISYLSSATGRTPAQVRDDLDDMLDDGLFPQGFLDYGGDRLVLSNEEVVQQPEKRQEAPPSPAKEDENAVLAEIKTVNDAIDNEKMSAQIDRIGVITAKILDYQKSHPDKAPQLHSFLSYYLPTTLKILRAYAQLEDQEISGQNITAAMQRIEGMMDKVVEGFEKQLDLLFQGDAMDITTDVEVLERMLAKDGLSDQEGLTLGI